jgi:hypothetical protein
MADIAVDVEDDDDDDDIDFVSVMEVASAALQAMEEAAKERAEMKKVFRKHNPRKYFYAMNTHRATELFNAGLVQSVEEGRKVSADIRKNRSSLDWCRESADRYLGQLTDLEFQGLFRMDRTLFQSAEDKLRAHFESKKIYSRDGSLGGKAATPTKFLLAGTLRWLAGGSAHDIIYFCGVRYRTLTRYRWDVLQALDEIYFSSEIRLPSDKQQRDALSDKFEIKTHMKGIIGAIDGLLVHIHLPAGTKNARPFRCYKSYYALNMQAVAGPDGEFLYVNIGHAGAVGERHGGNPVFPIGIINIILIPILILR